MKNIRPTDSGILDHGHIAPAICRFHLDQWVKTPHGEKGFVTMLGFDHSGRRYLVCFNDRTEWWRESELKATAK
jgi:hypothetical protein